MSTSTYQALQDTLQDKLKTNVIYKDKTITVQPYYSNNDVLLIDPDIKNHIKTQLQNLCMNTELNSEYAYSSMFANQCTLTIFSTPTNSIGVLTRSMIQMIGFVTFSIKNIEHYKKYNNPSELPETIDKNLRSETININSPTKNDILALDVIVCVKGGGLGYLLINFLNETYPIFLKSVYDVDTYGFYIKRGFKHFAYKTNFYELPYKFCNEYFFTNYKKNVANRCYTSNGEISSELSLTNCNDFTKGTFKSWYNDNEEFPDDEGLIPLILPMPPQTSSVGGSNKSSTEYITVLGRRRKIVMQGRKKMVMVMGVLTSLTDAKKTDKETKKKQTKNK